VTERVTQSPGGSASLDGVRRAVDGSLAFLLLLVDTIAALLLAADLIVVSLSVYYRYVLAAPIEWADDVARGLMVALSFFGAAGALARNENVGVAFFVQRLSPRARPRVEAVAALVVLAAAASIAWNAIAIGRFTTGQTTGSGLPLEWTFYPMGAGALCMTIFALAQFCRQKPPDIAFAVVFALAAAAAAYCWRFVGAGAWRSGLPMALAFMGCLAGGVPIGFALAFTALIYIWIDGAVPGLIFAQQMARGIDNFVLLAIPFFILVGYLMEANGMSVRLIALLERLVGRTRGGLNVVMVLAMVIFSGISGSKMADVAAVGSVMIPAARRSRQNPGGAVALLAASAQSLAFILTLQQFPQALAQAMVALSQSAGAWPFLLLSIFILILMGSILEGAAALIIFAPLLIPVAGQIGFSGLHFGVVLVIAMGIGLFAPPLGLGLYGACLIGGVPIETTVKPMLGYLGLLLLCLLVIAFVPGFTLWLPHRLGYQ
jgi:TRAP-type C4-dicarboxylate transport system permease small subunit